MKEMIASLRDSVQSSLGARLSRICVEMPVGLEFGVETSEAKAKRKGGARLVTAADVVRSNRELARLFVGMFEGTGLKPLVLFATEAEARAAAKQWDSPALEARVQALVGAAEAARSGASAAAPSTGGGGFGSAPSGKSAVIKKKPKGGSKRPKGGAVRTAPPLVRVPPNAEVVVVVAPGRTQLDAAREFCEASGMDKLVVVLNPRLEADGIGRLNRAYFSETRGDFTTAFAFLTQPLGPPGPDDKSKDPLVLWRAYPDEWVLARKPGLGPPRTLVAAEQRPTQEEMKAASLNEGSGFLGGIFA
jgi:hypothetical protein